jgi:hypothetical protein
MKQLEIWFSNNELITKTVAMSFHLCHSKPTYKPRILLQNKDIEYKTEVKFLGLCITENLAGGLTFVIYVIVRAKIFLIFNLLKTF